MKHTPGPWQYEPIDYVSGDEANCDVTWINDAEGTVHTICEDVLMPNARLIAAAPELLEACEELIIEMDVINVPSLHVMKLIRDAAFKAHKGEK